MQLFQTGSATPIATDSNGGDGWSFQWSPADGIYILYVAATDNDGKVSNPGLDQDVPNIGVFNYSVGRIVIDAKEGFDNNGFVSSTSTSFSNKYGSDTMYNYSLGSGEYYTFPFEVPFSGSWKVYMWSPDYSSASTALPLKVTHDGGTASLDFNQRTNPGDFELVGTYTFTQGSDYTLKLEYDGTTEYYGFADAIALEPNFPMTDALVSIAVSDAEFVETGNAGVVTFNRSLNSGSLDITYTIAGTAKAGTDYATLGGNITFPDGVSSVTLPITPIDDSIVDDDETVILTLVDGAGYDLSPSSTEVTLTLVSDDLGGEFDFTISSKSFSETGGTFTLDVTRTEGSSEAVSVDVVTSNGTATTSNNDYDAINTTLNWAHLDSATKSVVVTVNDDDIYESNEKFTVKLQNPTSPAELGDKTTVTVTITNNDTQPVISLVSPSTENVQIDTGANLLIDTTVTDSDGLPNALTLTWSQVSGPGTARFGTPSAADTSVTFDTDGLYVIRLSADDGGVVVTQDLNIGVGAGGEARLVVAEHNFESKNDSGGSGWAGNWSNKSNTAWSKDNPDYQGAYALKLKNSSSSIRRSVGLAGYSGHRASFQRRIGSGWGASDNTTLRVNDGGGWQTMAT